MQCVSKITFTKFNIDGNQLQFEFNIVYIRILIMQEHSENYNVYIYLVQNTHGYFLKSCHAKV